MSQTLPEIKQRLRKFCDKAESDIGPPCADLVSDLIVNNYSPAEKIPRIADYRDCDVIQGLMERVGSSRPFSAASHARCRSEPRNLFLSSRWHLKKPASS